MENQKNSKTGILDLLGISPRIRRHLAPRTPMKRMYCGKAELTRPRMTMDDLMALDSAERHYRQMSGIYEAEMAVAHAATAR